MKRIVYILTLILAFSSIICLMVGCNDKNNEEPIYTDYTVTVIDGLGNPVSNVFVNFISPDGTSKLRATEKDGVAVYKNALATDYKIAVEQGLSEAVILQSEFKLTKDVTSIKVIVRDPNKSFEIYGSVPDKTFAYNVGIGTYTPIIEEGKISYVVFNATQPGIYKVSVEGNMNVAYYGLPLIVQSSHCGDGEYDGKSFELIIKDTNAPYVFGVKGSGDMATLKIERTGDAPFNPYFDAEWVEVVATANIVKHDTSGKTISEIDIASPDLSVSLGEDGYYYTDDGKMVYIRITSQTTHGYVNESFEFVPILSGTLALISGNVEDSDVGINFGGYVYDDEGNFVNKYRYNGLIKTYIDYADANGVVALTEELADCIMLHGESNGWWNPDSNGYLFDGMAVNHDNAWLFLCVTAE